MFTYSITDVDFLHIINYVEALKRMVGMGEILKKHNHNLYKLRNVPGTNHFGDRLSGKRPDYPYYLEDI